MRVMVTGGAKRLGAAIVRAVAVAGHEVVIHYNHSTEAARELAADVGATTVSGDLSDPDALPDLFARATVDAPLTGIVNSASIFEYDAPDAIDPALASRLNQVNAVAPARLAAMLAAQADVSDGAVVNLLDQKLANPNPDFFSYTLTKYALAGATEMLAQALAPRIRVNAIAPGLTLPSGDQSAEQFQKVASANLLRRPVGADAVAGAVVYLLGARSITGQTLFVDCGQRFVKSDRDVMFEGRDG